MRSDVEAVLLAAMRLPPEARAALAAELIQSLEREQDEPAEDVEAAWAAEIRRRIEEVDAGEVATIPWPEARARILAVAKARGKAG